jgi:hypothetical protein
MTRQTLSISLFTVALLAGCASAPHESVSIEKKGKTTIIHHRSLVGNGARDRIEAISPSGVVTTAEVHVYDLGRYVDGSGGVHEAHRYYRTLQSERPNLMLPQRVSGGPRTSYAPPNYVPPPQDQRINDAVAEAKEAKQKLDDAKDKIEKRIAEDNNLRGELDQVQQQNQALQAQLDASMSPQRTAKPAQTDAEKAAESATATSDLQKWGQTVGQQTSQ